MVNSDTFKKRIADLIYKMGLEDIPEVDIDSSAIEHGSCKFIVIAGPEDKRYLYARAYLTFHNGVFNVFKEDVSIKGVEPSLFHCIGGGKMTIQQDEKKIRAYGTSINFGKFDVNVVRILLESYVKRERFFNGFSIQVE